MQFSQLLLSALSIALAATTAHGMALMPRAGGYYQVASGQASFTEYTGCQEASCGYNVVGYSAAMNMLSFGSDQTFGDACGRCFRITANEDPYTPSYPGPFPEPIVVKVNDLCAYPNSPWCNQTTVDPANGFGKPVHFDLCADSSSGAGQAFFNGYGREAFLGTFEEVSCSEWSGSDSTTPNWSGCDPIDSCNCLVPGETAAFWPNGVGCGNNPNVPPPS